MSFLANLNYDDNIKDEKDTVASAFSVFASDVYEATIKYAYLSQAQSGAGAVNFEFDIDGKTYKETMYVTNKQGQNYYERQGERHYLPSFIHADAISLFATGEPLSKQKQENKVINLYNFDAQKEVPTEVPMLTGMLNKKVKLGILKELVYKQTKDNSGNYVDTDETREQNRINKVFSAKDGRTVNEVKAESKEANFITTWLEKWQGEVSDKTTNKKPAQTQAKKTPSLFA